MAGVRPPSGAHSELFPPVAERSGWLRAGLVGPLRSWSGRLNEARLRWAGWYDPEARSEAPAVFIGGCERTGTTLLREILARHPSFAVGVETAVLVPPFSTARIADRWGVERSEIADLARRCHNVVELAERLYDGILLRDCRPRWVDKAPANARVVRQLLTWFPNGRFIHVIRDGRDVACSLRHHPHEVLRGGTIHPVRTNRPIAGCARSWRRQTQLGLAGRGHDRYLEVRYEDLVLRPGSEVRHICTFLDEPFEPSMLMPAPPTWSHPARLVNNRFAAGQIRASSVGRWRRDLTPEERETVAEEAGDLLAELGYAFDDGWVEE